MKSNASRFSEKSFALVVYRAESGRVISVTPMSDRIKPGDNLYSCLISDEADRLRIISKDFLRLPVLCVLDGRSAVVARSLQGGFDIGVILIFDYPVESFLWLAEAGRLDLVRIDRKFIGEITENRKEPSDAEKEGISSAYSLMLNSLYNIDVDTDVSGAVASLADLAGCRVAISDEVIGAINKMSKNERNNILTMLFLTFLFAAREGKRREIEIGCEMRYGEPIIIFSSELVAQNDLRGNDELCEFIRIAEQQDLLFEGIANDYGNTDNKLRIELNPKTLDFALLGIKLRPQLED